jgi:hypothetical protein
MANAVETFRGISILILKGLLWAVIGVIGITLAVIGIGEAYYYFTKGGMSLRFRWW